MYSIAISTVLALLLLCCAAVPVITMFAEPPDWLLEPFVAGGGGRSDAISWRAVLIRFLRPCSAILCEVRLDVRLVERASG